jgi:3D (Asp-Asp-Asp) domain-containing protein
MKNKIVEYLSCFVAGVIFWGGMFLLAEPFLQKPEEKEVVEIAEQQQEQREEKEAKEQTEEFVCLGEFVLTAYCGENYPHICNDGDATKTATGTRPLQGKTIAVDPSVIPYGTEVVINGNAYIAEDCGGAIKNNRIDIFFDSHSEALNFGKQTAFVYIKK